MIVGETQMEFGTPVDCEKTKGLNMSLAGKRGVELALDFLAQDSRRVAAAGDEAHVDRLIAAAPRVAPPAPVEIEAGEAELREMERGHAIQARSVQGRTHLNDVNRAVGIQV